MPKHTNAFDFNALPDVVLHLRYTAREGGEILRNAARKAQQDALANSDNGPLARFFSLEARVSDRVVSFSTSVGCNYSPTNFLAGSPAGTVSISVSWENTSHLA